MSRTYLSPVFKQHLARSLPQANQIHRRRSSGHEQVDPSQGTAGIVYERLKSRGYVKTVELRSSNYHHIYDTITSAFSTLITETPIMLLRKTHKSSRLHFLNSGHIDLWSADHLERLFMKAPRIGLRRLFITTPSAYDQSSTGRSWQSIRELPRHEQSTSPPTSFVSEADARESCWTWDSRLDLPLDSQSTSSLSWHSSFDSHLLSPKSDFILDARSDASGDTNDAISEVSHEGEFAQRPTPSPLTPVSEVARPPLPPNGVFTCQ